MSKELGDKTALQTNLAAFEIPRHSDSSLRVLSTADVPIACDGKIERSYQRDKVPHTLSQEATRGRIPPERGGNEGNGDAGLGDLEGHTHG